MLINTENYFDFIAKIGIEYLSAPIKKMHDLVVRITGDGKDWSKYQTYKSAWDKQFEAVELLFKNKASDKISIPETKTEPKKEVVIKEHPRKQEAENKEAVLHTVSNEKAKGFARELIENYVKRGDSLKSLRESYLSVSNEKFSANISKGKIFVTQIEGNLVNFSFSLESIFNEIKGEIKPGKHISHSSKKHTAHEKPKIKVKGKGVELVSPEIVFIKRFALLNGEEKNRQQVLNFIKAIQKAIVERRIRKTSKYAAIIAYMQKQLVNTYNGMKESIGFSFANADYIKYLKIAGAEHLMPSVRFIKSYINMLGQTITKKRAGNLFEKIGKAIEKKRISQDDKYIKHLHIVLVSLERFLKTGDSPSISEAQLNGLQGVLESCGCNLHGSAYRESYGSNLEGIEETETAPKNTILNSKQVIDLKPDKLGFAGKWLDFIGNPSRGFTAMIFGKPKFGKSYLALEFAGYLARNHGKVLYVAREEGFDDTLQQKLKDKNVVHDNLFVSDYLPNDLNEYDFVFFDSVNKLALSPSELEKLERKYPGISFIYIFQTNKDGDFKGAMQFQHNADVVIEVPQKGLAVQYGRYNQGGEMRIFG